MTVSFDEKMMTPIYGRKMSIMIGVLVDGRSSVRETIDAAAA